MEYRYILAKSVGNKDAPDEGATLKGHIKAVVDCFKIIFGHDHEAPTKFSNRWLDFFKLEHSDFGAFHKNAALSCMFHDAGKANNGFQDIVQTKKGVQVIRHEHLSGLILWLPEVAEWIQKIQDIDIKIVFSAVVSHHLKTAQDAFASPLHPDLHKVFKVYPDAIQGILNMVSSHFPVDACRLSCPEIWDFEGGSEVNPSDLRENIKKMRLKNYKRILKKETKTKRLLMAVRAALIVADSAGSAIVREKKEMKPWLEEAFSHNLDGGYIEKNVLQQRIKTINKNKNQFSWNDFQNAAEMLPKRSLLIAPCGSGKTLAAWKWIKGRLSDIPATKVIFLYPTRATATEGFKDYVSWAPEADASLIHGAAKYDLQGMFSNPVDQRSKKDFAAEDRMFALGYWHSKIFSATVDQFLGFMQHSYRSVCLLPVLSDSVVVFDEVHSFDKSLFSALKLFLKNFNTPALCMTASLPKSRRDDLTNDCGLTLFPTDEIRFHDLENRADMPRYKIKRINPDEVEALAVDAYESGKRVLWVVNTVSRCQDIAKRFNAICYHSRFKLQDRKTQHRIVISAFQQTEQSALAITTQVCEMSLDLDADVVISEVAPITSMIQRMGRCNRHARIEDNKIGYVYFYMPADEKPYSPDELKGAEEFLNELHDRTATQKLLETLLEKFCPADIEVEKYAAFLESGPWAISREASLRDENDFTVNAVLDADTQAYYDLKRKNESVEGLFVPVPRRFAKAGRFPAIAPSAHYDPEYGFFDYPLEAIL